MHFFLSWFVNIWYFAQLITFCPLQQYNSLLSIYISVDFLLVISNFFRLSSLLLSTTSIASKYISVSFYVSINPIFPYRSAYSYSAVYKPIDTIPCNLLYSLNKEPFCALGSYYFNIVYSEKIKKRNIQSLKKLGFSISLS